MRTAILSLYTRPAVGFALFAILSAAAGPVGTVCSACQAAGLANGAISIAAASGTNFSITGTVAGVSYDQNVIEVLAAGVKETIHVTPTTSIAKHGESGSISDIRPGAHVAVSGVIQEGQHIAVTIEIK